MSPKMSMVKSTRRNLKWFDSLLWLGIAGVLAALLVPRQQTECKHVPPAAKTSMAASPYTEGPVLAPPR